MALVLKPTARYLILCHDIVTDERWPGKTVLIGPISWIKWPPGRPPPLTFPDLRLYFVLTDGRGKGQIWVSIVDEELNEEVYASPKKMLSFEGKDPIGFYVGVLRLTPCHFPRPGVYACRLCFEDAEVAHCIVHVR
jgi:hypothetical protein